jgi:PAS domain S-box-containing protein
VGLLLVDDDENDRVALRAVLESPEYRVVEAESAKDALRKLLDDDFAVLLVDIVMPGMNGFELAAAVKARERTAAVPIIFLTGHAGDVNQVYQGYRAGAVDYLIKPAIPAEVRAKVGVFAELYRQRRQIEQQAALLIEAGRRESELRLVDLQLAHQRRYHALAEAIPQIVWTARPEGEVDYFNRRWFEYAGLSLDVGGSWLRALHPEDEERCRERWADALHTGAMLEVECRLRRSNGAYRWHLCRAVPERSMSGQIVSWLGTFTDIEDQKQSQAALAEFKGTLDAVFDAVFIFAPDDWRFLYVNQGASLLLGYSRAELGTMRPVDLLVDRDEVSFRELLAPLCEGSQAVITLETQVRRRDLRTVPVEVSMQFIQVDGGRIVSIARDITDRKRAQLERELLYREAVDAVRARDEFLSVASHELKTPISALHLQVETLLRAARKEQEVPLPAEKTRAKLELIERQIDRLVRLIGELMDVSRITAGRLRLELEETDFVAVVLDVVSRYAEEAGRANSPLGLRVAEGQHVIGKWDRLRLEQVVTNLLTNAIKFGAGRAIEIGVEAQPQRAVLTVTDRGEGIAPEDVDRIFQRYEQATTSHMHGGLGLGLYIVRQIVEAHGGAIRVESRRGAGSTFTVELPYEPPPPPSTKELETASPELARQG